jgi:hypothetical protein
MMVRASLGWPGASRERGHPSALLYDRCVPIYRDPLAGVRGQVATKRAAVESSEERLSPLRRALLPERIRQLIEALRPRAVAEAESLEALADAETALDGLLAAYDEVAALPPSLFVCPDDVPDPRRPTQPPPLLIEEERQKRFRFLLARRVAELASDAYVVRWGDTTYLARLRIDGTPLVVTARMDPTEEIRASFWCTLRTSVPDATPSLVVRRERALESVGKRLGLVEDRSVGHHELDRVFVVSGEPPAPSMLTPAVAEALVALAPWDVALRVARGVVDLAWSGQRATEKDLVPDAALAVMLGVRAAVERA